MSRENKFTGPYLLVQEHAVDLDKLEAIPKHKQVETFLMRTRMIFPAQQWKVGLHAKHTMM